MPKLLLIERINTQLAMHSLHLSVPHEIYLDGKIEIYTAISDSIKKQHIIKDMELFILDKYYINLLLDDYVIYSKNRHAFWNNLLDWVPTNTGASGISLEYGQQIILALGIPDLELMKYSHTLKLKPF